MTSKYAQHLKHNKKDNAQMHTVVIISLWSSLYIAHSAKILNTGKIYIYVYVYVYIHIYIYEEHTSQFGTYPLFVKNEPAMSCTRTVWGHRIPFSHI